MGLKVLVCGGRDYFDYFTVERVLDAIHYGERGPITAIVHGDAPGADRQGRHWAIRRKVKHRPYPADWETHGRSAGHIRNQQMLDEEDPDLVVSFPGGRGTASMVAKARKAKTEVMEIA